MAGLLAKIGEALTLLHAPSSTPETRKQADRFLSKELMRDKNCWNAVNMILENPEASGEAHFFASNTLYRKLKYNFGEVPKGNLNGLKNTILGYIKRFGRIGPKRRTTVVQLTKCPACLALHWPEWENPIGDILDTLNSQEDIFTLLECLRTTAEELDARKIPVARQAYQSLREKMTNNALRILKVFQFVFASPNCPADTKIQVLKAFAPWIQQMSLVPPKDLYESDIFKTAFQTVINKDIDLHVFEVGVEAVEGIVKVSQRGRYQASLREQNNPGGVKQWEDLKEKIVDWVLKCTPAFEGFVNDEDIDRAKGLSKIFAAAGQVYENQLLNGEGRSQELLAVLVQVLANSEREISWPALGFWMGMSQQSAYLDPNQIHNVVRQAYLALLPAFAQILRRPVNMDELQEACEREYDEAANYRRDGFVVVKETMIIVSSVDFLAKCTALLEQAAQAKDARALEVVVTMIAKGQKDLGHEWIPVKDIRRRYRDELEKVPANQRQQAIQEMVQREEQKRPLLEKFNLQIGQLLVKLPGLADTPHYKSAVCDVFGSYIQRFPNNDEFVKTGVQYVVACLKEKKSERHAIDALYDICRDLKKALLPLLKDLLTFSETATFLSIESQSVLMTSLCSVGSHVPAGEVSNSLSMFLRLPYQKVVDALKGPQPSNHNPLEKGGKPSPLYQALKLLADVLKHFTPHSVADADPHPVVQAFERLWKDFLENIIKNFNDESLMEKCTKCIKCTIRTAPKQFIKSDVATASLALLAERYQTQPFSCYLYIATIYVDEYGKEAGAQAILQQVLDHFSKCTLSSLNSFDAHKNNPDQVEDYFELCVKYLKVCPQLLVNEKRLEAVWQSALKGIGLDHKESGNAILNMLDQSLLLVIQPSQSQQNREDDHQRQWPPPQAFQALLQELLQKYGQELIYRILMALAEQRNNRTFTKIYLHILNDLWMIDSAQAKNRLQVALGELKHEKTGTILKPANPTKEEFFNRFCNAQSNQDRRTAFTDFQDSCARFLAGLDAWET